MLKYAVLPVSGCITGGAHPKFDLSQLEGLSASSCCQTITPCMVAIPCNVYSNVVTLLKSDARALRSYEAAGLQGFIFTWLIGYSALLGPIGGILLADYHIVRRRSLDVDALFSRDPTMPYWFQVGTAEI